MIKITDKKLCSGCGACASICPQKCINIIHDQEGFRYPKVEEDKCIKCGLCIKVCPIINVRENKNNPLSVCGAVNKNFSILKSSSSGGVFTELAKYILSSGGVVFGATYDKDVNVIHSFIEKEEDIYKMRGSKYAESNTNEVYIKVKEFLNSGRLVLFSGTPCQIAGLKFFLGKEFENLITCDFICLGVPSNKIYNAYKSYYERKYSSKVTNIEFRNKKDGWVHFNMVFHFENDKKKYILRYMNPYILTFYKAYSIRPSCYKCKFRGLNSGSDIKLADFWRARESKQPSYNFYGVSHVFINTKKGERIFEKIKDNFDLTNSDYEEALQLNGSLSSIRTDIKERDKFMKKISSLQDEEIVEEMKNLCSQNVIEKAGKKLELKCQKLSIKNKLFVLCKRYLYKINLVSILVTPDLFIFYELTFIF